MSSTFDAETGPDGVWTSARRDDGAAQVRLFCFPYAGGGTALYYRWSQWLPPTVHVCPVELPGHGRRLREPAFRQIEPLVAAAAEGLRTQLDRPFAFFGHSLGAWIAFELARHLRQAYGLLPFHL